MKTVTICGSMRFENDMKIDLSDAIYVLDIDGYIDESVKKEIEYAGSKGIEVIYHTDFMKSMN